MTRLWLHIVYLQNILPLKICPISVVFGCEKSSVCPCAASFSLPWWFCSSEGVVLIWPALEVSMGCDVESWVVLAKASFLYQYVSCFDVGLFDLCRKTNVCALSSRSLLVNCPLSEVSMSCELALVGCTNIRTRLTTVLLGLCLRLCWEDSAGAFCRLGRQHNYLTCLIGK